MNKHDLTNMLRGQSTLPGMNKKLQFKNGDQWFDYRPKLMYFIMQRYKNTPSNMADFFTFSFSVRDGDIVRLYVINGSSCRQERITACDQQCPPAHLQTPVQHVRELRIADMTLEETLEYTRVAQEIETMCADITDTRSTLSAAEQTTLERHMADFDMCSMCLDDLAEMSTMHKQICYLPCLHIFCHVCLIQCVNNNNITCPHCRAHCTKDDIHQLRQL